MLISLKFNLAMCVTLLLVLITTNQVASQYSRPLDQNSRLDLNGASQGSLRPQDCGPRCTMRCSATQYNKACMSFCQKCCAKCLCVPPGTYGNKQLCPCYNNWKTKRGGPKCP